MEKFIIDTDRYSGNFEREMTAFITGLIGECGVGSNLSREHSPIDGVILVPDENECRRPCAIEVTPGYHNNGLGFHFKDGQEADALAAYKKSAIEYETQWMNIEEGHRGKNRPTWTDEAINSSVLRRKEKIAEIEAETEVSKWPAYQSVAIFFADASLTPELINILKERAKEYVQNYTVSRFNKEKITIEGFRMASIVTSELAKEI